MEKLEPLINQYIQSRMKNRQELTYTLERLNGLSNDIFLLSIIEKENRVLKETCIFRKFGQISEMVDRNLEGEIIEKLALKGLTPKIIDTDKKIFRFEEYIDDGDVISKDYARSEKFIEKLIHILVFYTTLSFIHNYKITFTSDDESTNPQIEITRSYDIPEDSQQLMVNQNMFDLCMKKLHIKANLNFEKFKSNFLQNYYNHKYDDDHNILIHFEKFCYYVKNFKEIFLKVFPTEGLFVLNHNDLHKLNLLSSESGDKIYILDHEYAALNLIGIDIVNFLIETNFDYTVGVFPFYEYTPERIDFEKYHKVFLDFLYEFVNKQREIISPRQYGELEKSLEIIKTFEYFLSLVRIISLFWMLYCAVYIDYYTFEHKEKFDYFKHASDRIALFETAEKILNNINKVNIL